MKTQYILIGLFASLGLSAQVTTEAINFNHGSCNFKGTLYWPDSEGTQPVAVLIPGSGQNDRNGTVVLQGGNADCLYPDLVGNTLRPYRDLALGLAADGYAVLTYDELGVSCPSFSGPFSFENLWMPVESALDFLRVHPKTKPENIFLIGHSEGAMLAPYVALRNSDVFSVVSLGGARSPLDSMIARQLVEFAEMCDQDVNDARFQGNQILIYFNFVRQGIAGLPDFAGASAVVWRKYINVNDSVAINYNLLNIPTLMVGFGDDLNVPPDQLERFRNETSNSNIDFFELEGLNHFMTPSNDPAVSSVLIDTLVQWLNGLVVSDASFLQERNQPASLKPFPNPSIHQVRFELPEMLSANANVKVYRLNGRYVAVSRDDLWIESQFITIDIEGLIPGIYFLRVSDGGHIYSGKFVKGE